MTTWFRSIFTREQKKSFADEYEMAVADSLCLLDLSSGRVMNPTRS